MKEDLTNDPSETKIHNVYLLLSSYLLNLTSRECQWTKERFLPRNLVEPTPRSVPRNNFSAASEVRERRIWEISQASLLFINEIITRIY